LAVEEREGRDEEGRDDSGRDDSGRVDVTAVAAAEEEVLVDDKLTLP
jgi:hypothetical protein